MDVRCCKYILYIAFIISIDVTVSTDEYNESPQNKNGRFLSMFEIINFPNDACTGDSKNGTCYTSAECEDKGGTKDGDCAQGYGVCCSFQVECGATITQNNTYFTKPSSFSTGNCAVQVCPDDDICQLRLDFTSFVINGPYSTTDTTIDTAAANSKVLTYIRDGTVSVAANGIAVIPLEGHCTKGSLTVTSSSGVSPPVICGTNSGEHIYVDAKGGSCNAINLDVNTASSDNTFNIQITQLACDFNNLAPPGCTQYFFGSANGIFQSFNWDGGNHLANQNQNICFRRESGKTKICYSTVTNYKDFRVSNALSGIAANSVKGFVGDEGTANGAACCNYGNAGIGGKGGLFDCLQIPDATDGADNCVNDDVATPGEKCVNGSFCGQAGLAVTNSIAVTGANASTKKTICSKRSPFQVRFLTDSVEGAEFEVATGIGIQGFHLAFIES